ncbi:MAG: hypothetical protein P8Y94_03610, partial [Acidobacteriota bacterium]
LRPDLTGLPGIAPLPGHGDRGVEGHRKAPEGARPRVTTDETKSGAPGRGAIAYRKPRPTWFIRGLSPGGQPYIPAVDECRDPA